MIFFSFCTLYGQTPCFETNDTIGCVPHTVDMTNCSGELTVVYVYEQNGSFDSTTSTTFTFTEGGSHSITQLIGTGSGIVSLTKEDYIRVVDPVEPNFELQACEGLEVRVFISDTNYSDYLVEYPDGVANDTLKSWGSSIVTFPSDGTKSIRVTGFYPGFTCSNSLTQSVETIISLEKPPLISFINSESEKEITFNTNPLLEYFIEIDDGSGFTIIDSITSNNSEYSYVFTTGGQTPSIKVSSFDRCGNSIVSDSLASVFLSGTAQNNQNELLWTNYGINTQFVDYTIIRDGDSLTSLSLESFDDVEVSCGFEYCYLIKVNTNLQNDLTGDPVLLISNSICLNALSSDIPPPIDTVNSTYTLVGEIDISWSVPENPSASFFTVYKNEIILDNTSDSSYLFSGGQSEDCFRLSFVDVCGNESPLSAFTCPIYLRVQSDNQLDYTASWTVYDGSLAIDQYQLVFLSSSGEVIESVDVNGTQYEFSWPSLLNQEMNVLIQGVDSEFDVVTISNSVFLEQELRYSIPTAFTPNEDGLNDGFSPIGGFIGSFEMRVFNQWGALVYKGAGRWDGKSSGGYVPEGTYYYEVTITDQRGRSETDTGNVTVIY